MTGDIRYVMWYVLAQNTQIWWLGLKIFKKNDRFENSTFEIGYKQDFVKVRKLIIFGPKMPKFGHLGSKFLKTNVGFEISTMNIWCQQNFVKIRKLIRFSPKCLNLGIWAQCLKNESRKKIPDFPNIETFGR